MEETNYRKFDENDYKNVKKTCVRMVELKIINRSEANRKLYILRKYVLTKKAG